METFYGIVFFLHIVAATIFVVTMAVMQLAVGPAMAKIPAGEEKEKAIAVLHGRWHPVVDNAILVVLFTGIYMASLRWKLIGTVAIMHIKVSLGIITLLAAVAIHFYLRKLKKRLKAEGDTERLSRINRFTPVIEKIVLVLGWLTFLMGIAYNHPFY